MLLFFFYVNSLFTLFTAMFSLLFFALSDIKLKLGAWWCFCLFCVNHLLCTHWQEPFIVSSFFSHHFSFNLSFSPSVVILWTTSTAATGQQQDERRKTNQHNYYALVHCFSCGCIHIYASADCSICTQRQWEYMFCNNACMAMHFHRTILSNSTRKMKCFATCSWM